MPTNGPQLTLVVAPAVLLPFTTLAVCMRLYSRILTKQGFKIDDYLVALGLILAYGLYADVVVCVVWGGLGVDITLLTPANIEIFAKAAAIASGILWGTAVCITQLSILFFYIRVFGLVQPWIKYTSYVVIAMVTSWWIALFGTIMGECIPMSKLWTPMVPGKCISQSKMCGGGGISHIIIDFIILCLPLWPVWKLHTKTSRKVYVSFIFLLGIIATLCSVLRVSCLVSLVKIDESNATASMWLSFFLEILEVVCGIICVCIPAFPPVLVRMKNSRLGSYAKGIISTSKLSPFSSKRSTRQSSRAGDDSSEKSITHPLPKVDPTNFITSPKYLSVDYDARVTTGGSSSSSDKDAKTLRGDSISEHEMRVTHGWDVHSTKNGSVGSNAV
ncbi:hypothetical protein K432DRAFT_341944 [Lepidopterella palustris CBS 459.81]|uniref:Rhodopsin domain-containing protein n=1 Tax=Lepidopterella palustris CBS 459.81 TaxID=1314670 RepID=A0A8E2ELJ7_9PEZI|nr:hypothetical protein K432DRAFT_341944 [Lepidopterella palustris CBS 459.81]